MAVLLVVLYHAELPLASAGYLGVDIFFVISGFLITRLISQGIEAGRFSFRQFYYRRAKRLLPASYVVIALTVLAAPYFVTELELEQLKAQALGAVTFTTNLVLWQQSGYFDGDADNKVLLHFWSLAIEEQYYLVLPTLLFFVPRQAWVATTAGVLLTSMTLCFYLAPQDPSAAFYLLPTRAWELSLGSLGALLPVYVTYSRPLSLARLPALLILLTIPLYPSGSFHPGLDALLVCTATLVVILGGQRGASLLGQDPITATIVWLGDISYSLYLVHWPVIVFTRAAWIGEAPSYAMTIAIVLSLALSWLLYTFVESPFHKGFAHDPQRVVAGLIAASLMIVATPIAIGRATATGTDYQHLRRANYGIDRSCSHKAYKFEGVTKDCRTTLAPKVLIWGDSYAMAWASALIRPLGKVGLEQATMSACDPLIGMARFPKQADERYNRAYAEGCLDFHLRVLDYIRHNEDLEVVIAAARFQTILSSGNLMLVKEKDGYAAREVTPELVAHGLARLVMSVRAAGKKVVVLAPPPANGMNIGTCLERRAKNRITFDAPKDCSISLESLKAYRAETWALLERVSELADVEVVDTQDFLCDEVSCKTEIDGKPLYRDAGHLSYVGAALIGDRSRLASDILQKAR
ncbi:hypothetical protein AUC69_12470 [Methyloceanibacter superfactus]|uniref:Acyltransferase n=1 Tax=Methyloceanibacter superfactus TaxID=1774969 RepID=A0A1E3VV41_9HYPH|nr:hypothetical protein AUC69_12470 [Methyloceanibacter superfactus]